MKKFYLFLVLSLLFNFNFFGEDVTQDLIEVEKEAIEKTKDLLDNQTADTSKSETKKTETDKAPPKTNNPYLLPISIIVSLSYSPFINIYTPPASAYTSFTFTFDLSAGAQYRFHKTVGLDTGLTCSVGMSYKQTSYRITNDPTLYQKELYNVEIYLQYYLNALIYLPFNIKLKNNYNLMFLVKAGLKFDWWALSYYYLYLDGAEINRGSYQDNVPDGPNIVGDYYNYSKYINHVNLGIHIGFAPKFHSSGIISVYPEIGATFYVLPTFYGWRDKLIGGYNYILVRNNYIKDRSISDFKMSFNVGITLSFDFGKYDDNLTDILKANGKIKSKSATTKKPAK
ncbi:MAG TPA: hypothetical protein PLG34_12190 [Spirochaetota bacterium]|jgi:hypothetical protein|nr:MAG: hypothetical protein BWX91_02209 [Spirochaetes bacterium ADurb.Bin133]HNZ27570.1 hypothetical protein [Spirochaetota bacterium]HPY88729.1 hypothetical protein [Spirochaetota bacterium]HQB62471.1 hypothetical protein [Spirochaetota bacterium]